MMIIFYHVTLLSADYHGDMKSQMPQSNCTSHTYADHIFCSSAAWQNHLMWFGHFEPSLHVRRYYIIRVVPVTQAPFPTNTERMSAKCLLRAVGVVPCTELDDKWVKELSSASYTGSPKCVVFRIVSKVPVVSLHVFYTGSPASVMCHLGRGGRLADSCGHTLFTSSDSLFSPFGTTKVSHFV